MIQKFIPDLGSWFFTHPRSRIPDPDPQHCLWRGKCLRRELFLPSSSSWLSERVRVVTLGGTNSEKDLKQEHHINIAKGGFKEIHVYNHFVAVMRIRIRRIRMFGPPWFASGSASPKYWFGSGSFHHQAKKVKKLISTVSWLLYDFYLWRMM